MNDRKPTLPAAEDAHVERENAHVPLALGQWYWVTSTESEYVGKKRVERKFEWLGCIMRIGSNHVQLESPHSASGYHSTRVHFDNFWTTLRAEPNAEAVIRAKVEHYQAESTRLLGEVQALTARLGLTPVVSLPGAAAPSPAAPGTALVALSAQTDLKGYQTSLVKAKETDLPKLFEAIKETNEHLTTWMTASTLPMRAMSGDLKEIVEDVEDRIFNISLYAGLTEEAVCCAKGTAAAASEKLHVMQRRAYMDEECLLDYRAGGMEFRNIDEFDAWIAKPENRDRILPFPRTLVAMRVRRNTKERQWDGSMLGAFVKMHLEQSDKFTFLYVRNGEQVWRLSCEMDFGSMIFPDKTMFDPSEPKMVKMFAHRVDEMISVAEYELLCDEYRRIEAASKAWQKANPKKSWAENPHGSDFGGRLDLPGHHSFIPDEWQPFDPSNVYYDDCLKEIHDRIKAYNRVAVIIQGLFDRSPVLHPHPPVRSWTADGFEQAIKLVYDGEMVLPHGREAPDFEAYRAQLNASLQAGSVVVGQEAFWLRKMAEKENLRRSRDWRDRSSRELTTFQPYGDPGPGVVAKINEWQAKAKKAIFRWTRERRQANNFTYRTGPPLPCSVTVPAGALFNVSAYTPGDYKRFFADSRTRAEYLQWAPLLLTAEDYAAGKLKLPR